MARPQKTIDWVAVGKLAGIHCTHEEIASFLEISVDTLHRAAKRDLELSFAEYYEEKKRLGAISLRRKQYELAMSGDRTLLIWLGKQLLKQSDKIQWDITSIPEEKFAEEVQRRLDAETNRHLHVVPGPTKA